MLPFPSLPRSRGQRLVRAVGGAAGRRVGAGFLAGSLAGLLASLLAVLGGVERGQGSFDARDVQAEAAQRTVAVLELEHGEQDVVSSDGRVAEAQRLAERELQRLLGGSCER